MNSKTKSLTIKDWDDLDRPREKLKAHVKKEVIISSSKSVYSFMAAGLVALPHEEFWVLYLNQSNKLIEK